MTSVAMDAVAGILREAAITAIVPRFRTLADHAIHIEPLVWLVDPLDGTTSFTRENPHWAVMTAFVRRRNRCLMDLPAH